MDGGVPSAGAQVPTAVPAAGDGFVHVGLLYDSLAEYLAAVSGFVRAALARGDPVLVVIPGFQAGPLREVLGDDWKRVEFADVTGVGRNPGRIISAVTAFVNSYRDRRVSAVGEPAWPTRSERELLEVARHEALSNLAFTGIPLTKLCPYDAAALPLDALAAARQTHPLLAGPGGLYDSQSYLGPGQTPPPCEEPLPGPPPGAEVLRYRADLGALRGLVSRRAALAGLPPGRAADLLIAASELAANTVRHTGQGGTLRVWQAAGELVCEISDHGRIADPLAGRKRPANYAAGGLGLWLVHQVCDLVETRTGPAGTTTRLHISLQS